MIFIPQFILGTIEYTYLFIYLIPAIFVFKKNTISNEKNNFIWNFYLFFIFLYIGGRFQVGGDWVQYLYTFKVKDFSNFSLLSITEDPAYELLTYILVKLNLSVLSLNLICASVFVYGLSKFALRQPSPWLVMAIASSYLFVVVGMGYTRQSLTLGLSMLALNALIDRKIITALIFYFVGSLFHVSLVLFGIVFIPYIKNIKLNFKYFIIIFLVSTIVIISTATSYDRILRMIQFFITEGNEMYMARGAIIRLILNLICALIFLSLANYFTKDKLEKQIYILISLTVIFLFYLSFSYSVFADRVNIYFTVLQLFVLSRLPYIFKNFANVFLIKIPILISFFILLLTWLILSPYSSSWSPYQNYLLPHEDRFSCNKNFKSLSFVRDVACHK